MAKSKKEKSPVEEKPEVKPGTEEFDRGKIAADALIKQTSTQQGPANRTQQIVMVVVFVIAAIFFTFTGLDPLSIFTPTPTPQVVMVTPQSLQADREDWIEVYFTEPNEINDLSYLDESVAQVLINYIDQSVRTIHIAAFEFNLTPFAEALLRAEDRGVQIRWVTDDEYGLEEDGDIGHGQFKMLQDAGISVIADDREGLMHNKFIVFDNRILWTGSTNLTMNGIFRNNNNAIVLHSRDIAFVYEQEFTEMWGGSFGRSSPPTVEEQGYIIDGIPVQVLFSAEDDTNDWIAEVVRSAETSVRIMAFSFTSDIIGDAVLDQAAAGVDVQGLFETRGSETQYSEMGKMYCAGIQVRQDGNPGTMHHKVIVVDGKTVITGSHNFSASADQKNDENALIITDPRTAAKYLQEFNRLWAEGTLPDPAVMPCP